MRRVVVDGYGKYVGKEANRIVIKEKRKTVATYTVDNLRQLVVSGGGAIGIDAINLLAENGVDLIVLNRFGKVTARLSFPEMRTVHTRKEQYYAYNDTRSFKLAYQFIYAKARNQYSLLGTWAKTRKDSDIRKAEKIMEHRKKIEEYMKNFEDISADCIDNVRNEIMGIEGQCSSEYWKGFGLALPSRYEFEGRSGRYASDIVNALLNYGYGILEGEVWRAIHFAGLDPYGGFLHADRPGKPSMVLDLMEEFRQQVVDKTIMTLLVKRKIYPTMDVRDDMYRLPDDVRKLTISEILTKMEEYVTYKEVRMKWCDLILYQARNVAKFLRGEKNDYKGFYLRW